MIQIGDELASLIGYTYNQLTDVQNSVAMIDTGPDGDEVTGGVLLEQVAEANSLLTQIRNLSDAIKRIYISGQQPNDLLDQRDLLLEELSKFGSLTVKIETDKGKPTGGLELDFFGIDVMAAETTLELAVEIKEAGGDIRETVCLCVGTETINLTECCDDAGKGIPSWAWNWPGKI
ncbi:MAG: hypothetical protein RQM92_02410 [Candidatus Syntrophopropionicum ammoniitolerans]